MRVYGSARVEMTHDALLVAFPLTPKSRRAPARNHSPAVGE